MVAQSPDPGPHVKNARLKKENNIHVQYRLKVSYQSRLNFFRDGSLVSRGETRVSRDERPVSRDSLKQQFWNKLQANCLATCLSPVDKWKSLPLGTPDLSILFPEA